MSSDFDSLEITGGEPLLHADNIYEFIKKYPQYEKIIIKD